jgi:hypothetical protein
MCFNTLEKGASKNFQTVANTFQTWMKHVWGLCKKKEAEPLKPIQAHTKNGQKWGKKQLQHGLSSKIFNWA